MVDKNPTTLFNDIYDSTTRKVLVYITAKCSSPADIHDIFQETYMELYSILVKKGPDSIQNSEAFVMKLAKQKLSRYYSPVSYTHLPPLALFRPFSTPAPLVTPSPAGIFFGPPLSSGLFSSLLHAGSSCDSLTGGHFSWAGPLL